MNGIAIAKNFRQERRLLRRVRSGQRAGVPGHPESGTRLLGDLPAALLRRRARYRAAGLPGRSHSLIDGEITAGDWFLFFQSVMLFWMPMTSIASFWSQFQQGLGASERIFALIDAEPEVVQSANDDPGRIRGEIEFRDLSFSYDGQATRAARVQPARSRPGKRWRSSGTPAPASRPSAS